MTSSIKVLYISAVVPGTTSGGRLAMYRHLILKQDFQVAVASQFADDSPAEQRFSIRRNRVIERLRRTALGRWLHNLEYWLNWVAVPKKLMQFAQSFDPDVVVCVVEDWHMGLAWQVAQRLNIPLVSNFQDLFCLSQFVHPSARPFSFVVPFLIDRYHLLNQASDQVFYTSEGMRGWFGEKGKGDVLYPMSDFSDRPPPSTASSPNSPIRVIYAGNCYGAYGRMLLRLAEAALHCNGIELRIFAAGNDWPADRLQEMSNAGIYYGFMPFEELKQELVQADAFLTVMSFEAAEEPFVRTSFTTKWLDYVPYGKPVFTWAPEYSTAYLFAQQHGAGISIANDNPEDVLQTIKATASNSINWRIACEGSLRVAETVLNAEKIHSLFVDRIARVTS